MKCIEIVLEDHATLRRALDILDGMISNLEGGERIEIADVMTILTFLRLVGVEYHQSIEEKVLVPALGQAAPSESPASQILLEHGEQRALVAAIDDALKYKRGTEFVRHARRLSTLLRSHFEKSDMVLRTLDEAAISKEQDSLLVAELTENHKQSENDHSFSRLESKYTGKTYRAVSSSGRQFAQAGGSGPYS